MRELFTRQLAKARRSDGAIDLAVLGDLVRATYDEAEADRRRTDRAISQMVEEVDRLHAQLRDAFDVVPEGLVLFDEEDRFVLWNKRYAELYPELGDHLAVGVCYADALRHVVETHGYEEAVGREEEWLRERLERHARPSNVEEQRLHDGRWLRIEECRTSDGGSVGIRVDITELKRREASFRLLYENNPVPMFVYDAETLRIVSVNDRAVAHYGYDRAAFLALTILDIRPKEDIEATLEAVAATLHDGRMTRLWRHRKADGSLIDVDIFAQPLTHDGRRAVLVAVIDVTERKKAVEDLQKTQEFLDTIVENIPVTLFVKEPREHRYILLNRAGELLFGRPRDQVVGKTADDLFAEDEAAISLAQEVELLNGDRQQITSHEIIETAHGGRRMLSVNRMAIFDESGQPQYLLGVAEDVTEKQRAEEKIAFLAHHDALTGLPNRAAFMQRLGEHLAEAEKTRSAFSVLSVDLDRFKTVNDLYGHPVGDLLLREVARRLEATAEGSVVARLGGDEFMLLCPDAAQPAASEILGARLKFAMAEEFVLDGHRLRSGMSIGIAVYPTDGRDHQTLLANADAALYRSKAEGRDTVRFFEPEMDRRLRDRRSLQNDLVTALRRGELSLHFQPQARIDGEVFGFEALLRWNHPTRGSVSPGVFIPLAEESNLIVEISEWVLREACRVAAAWDRPLTVAVNLSPVQFRHGDLPTLIQQILFETGLPPGRLELEITEGVLIGDFSRVVGLLRRIKAMGIKIAMDDFGTGYSSLSYLQSFPFDKIKIDRSFVSSIGSNEQATAIIRAVIGLCRGLDVPVIAEGVETEDQRAFLREEHCGEIQGFLIGRPLPIASYAEMTEVAPPLVEPVPRAVRIRRR
ncbi:EAL and GGDEF domain-containing protein [Pinisolibacter aquiterrae]|uniref:sensor domain-containing protein n=1 Tax=Pinisolibacter aquiterrae TaxID=2815579 RepID=UPI001C3C5BE5|nr:EAL domain-containing protein [Pinisolibacter aquiterrae]MBV5265410.1 EAL domain-containing protein [Pinisolibacter aquiterrae]MCC8235214.1 EAL domain-containing protein [Pinisolibacter aquiterrae]